MVDVIPGDPGNYKVGPKQMGPGFDRRCMSFNQVTHTAHIRNAINIVAERKIRADLVYDNSNLNTERIRVVWMSPNSWNTGSRYGNIAFEFNWEDVIRERKFYWVEVAKYKIPACRILFSTKEFPNHPIFKPYDPSVPNGPWWYDAIAKSHYYNNNYCLEFMIEDDIALESASGIDFVDHHAEWCNLNRVNPQNCVDLGRSAASGAAMFVAGICTVGLPVDLLKMRLSDQGNEIPQRGLVSAFESLRDVFSHIAKENGIKWSGLVSASDATAGPLINALLGAAYRKNVAEMITLMPLLKTEQDCIEALALALEDKFGIIGKMRIPRNMTEWSAWSTTVNQLNSGV